MYEKYKRLNLGFTLIELLVVIALIGIISSIGIVAYNGYASSAKQTAATNSLNAMSIGQLEYKSNKGTFYATSSPTSPNSTTTSEINLNLFGVTPFQVSGSQSNDKLSGQDYFFSSSATPTTFLLTAKEKTGLCTMTLDQNGTLTKRDC